jgi:hypothetical protein
MRVVVAPVLVDDRICRIVSAIQSLLEVEEWVGGWWEPSLIPLTLVSSAPQADPRTLRARGVPDEDCLAEAPRPTPVDIESLMRPRDPERPSDMRFDEDVHQINGPRKRKYPGNARFRRDPRGGSAADIDRRRDTDAEWTGPRRRATDTPPPDRAG